MRKKEHGKSMPSGDSASCAFMQTMLFLIFGSTWGLIFILPMTMAARVYVHCHWFGDTIAGGVIGILCATFCVKMMPILGLPLFNFVMQVS